MHLADPDKTRSGVSAGHGLYDINDVQLIPLLQGGPKATAGRDMAAERRYRRLLTSGLDLSKDFSVSYSYSLCHTLQTNLTQPPSDAFESRFVWNEYLTQDFRELARPCRHFAPCHFALCSALIALRARVERAARPGLL